MMVRRMPQPLSLSFLGAARTVTGSKYFLDTGGSRILFDAGLFQGLKDLRLRNWEDLPVPASSLDAIVLLVGFQAAGTRGRALLEGAPVVKIHGGEVPVRAKVAYVASMSAHANSTEIMRWLGGFTRPPRTTFLVHGEPVAMEALAGTIREQLGWKVHLPELGEVVTLEG